MLILEICANSIKSVLAAVEGGATRVELCTDLANGGTTPPLFWMDRIIKIADIQIFTLIRPRKGNFCYTENEFFSMKRDIHQFAEAGCHDVVFGILTEKNKVDILRNKELIAIARKYNLSTTFHRAIDDTENIFDAMSIIIELGFDRILTSGGKSNAIDGKEVIKEMIDKSAGKIVIMPGGGITENNISELSAYLNTNEFHGSFSKLINPDNSTTVSCPEKIKKTINILNKINRK